MLARDGSLATRTAGCRLARGVNHMYREPLVISWLGKLNTRFTRGINRSVLSTGISSCEAHKEWARPVIMLRKDVIRHEITDGDV